MVIIIIIIISQSHSTFSVFFIRNCNFQISLWTTTKRLVKPIKDNENYLNKFKKKSNKIRFPVHPDHLFTLSNTSLCPVHLFTLIRCSPWPDVQPVQPNYLPNTSVHTDQMFTSTSFSTCPTQPHVRYNHCSGSQSKIKSPPNNSLLCSNHSP